MIHPDTELRKVNDTIGYGVFATGLIPKGTIVYVKDPLEITVTPEEFIKMDENCQSIVNWFSYTDETGNMIISWDIAKYVNHSCNPNTISTGYGFEIAIRDIQPGEEICDEYGIFNMSDSMDCSCGSENCRKVIKGSDWDTCGMRWDEVARDSIDCFSLVSQPLLKFVDTQLYQELMQYLNAMHPYRSLFGIRLLRDSVQAEMNY